MLAVDASASPQLVKLNVGGTRFHTTMVSLGSKGPNFFTAMIENDISGRCEGFQFLIVLWFTHVG